MGTGGRKQCGRRAHLLDPAKIREGHHSQCARRWLADTEMIAFRSLRHTALVWITILLALVGLTTLVISYRLAKDQAAEFLDGQLRQVALNVGMGLPDAAETPGLDQDREERLAVTIWNADGSIARTSPTDVNIPRQSRAGFAYLTAMGRRWRVYTANDGARTVQVAQHMEVRDEIARGAALGAAAPVLILIPLSCWW